MRAWHVFSVGTKTVRGVAGGGGNRGEKLIA